VTYGNTQRAYKEQFTEKKSVIAKNQAAKPRETI